MLAARWAWLWFVVGLSVFGTFGGLAHDGPGAIGGPGIGHREPSNSIADPASGRGGSTGPLATVAGRSGLVQRILEVTKAAHVPSRDVMLPNLLGQGSISRGVVHPLTTVAPAPMGLGDFGVRNTSGVATPYMIQSTSWEGTLSLNNIDSFQLNGEETNTFGVQLNTVTTNTTVAQNTTNSFWTQDVFFYEPASQTAFFLDNIWNFSTPSTSEPASTFYSYNGSPVAPVFYYDQTAPMHLALPFTLHLYMNTSTTNNLTSGLAYPTVRFGANIVNSTGHSVYHGVFDTVLFNARLRIAFVPLTKFMVNGAKLTPTNFLLYDSEIMIGGPGGGTTASIYAINGSENLRYLNGLTGTYQNDPTAWNVGSDTGETSEGIAEAYTHPGTVSLSGGPSIPEPLWNATPGGHIGAARLTGTLTPSNGFLFASAGSSFDPGSAGWAPTTPSGSYDFTLPPGNYSIDALMSEHDPYNITVRSVNGTTPGNLVLTSNASEGIYTPLQAWDNGQLAGISSGGDGSPAHPYQVLNNQYRGLDPLFGESNDFLFPVFAGLFIADTDASVEIRNPATFGFTYLSTYDAGLTAQGLPFTNTLQIQVYNSSNVVLWGAPGITGWFFLQDYGPEGGLPMANVVFWDVTNSLIADNVFVSQGSSLLLMNGEGNPGGNVVWGNSFENGLQSPSFLYDAAPVGIFEYESGDLLYNNYVTTTVPAYSPSTNLWTGAPQTNLDDWNLSGVEPASLERVVDGFTLSGSVVASEWQCGNAWGGFTSTTPIPYNDGGLIVSGGDYCPYPIDPATFPVTFSETGLTSGSWSVALANATESALAGAPIAFAEPAGSWSYTVSTAPGIGISPDSGAVTVAGAAQTVAIQFTEPVPPPPPTRYTVWFSESGLPYGSWSAVLGNQSGAASAGAPISFSDLAGTYSYEILAQPGYTASPSAGTVTLPGLVSTISVTFSAPPKSATLYPVTLTEIGLAIGTAWSVTLNGDTQGTFGPFLGFSEPNGTYSYQVGNVPAYEAPHGGSITVSGGPAAAGVAFLPLNGTLNVTVTSPNAVVFVSGNLLDENVTPSRSGIFSAALPPGAYAVTVTKPGYAPFLEMVTVAPGRTTVLTVTLQAQPTSSGSALSTGQFGGLIAAILVLAAAVVVAGLLARRRPKTPEPSPQAWDEGKADTATPPK